MGARGPEPRFGEEFRGRPIVVYAGLPAIHWPAHPLARGGKVTLHRLVASESLGRLLTRLDRVRWRDGDRWNWDASNLEVVLAGPPVRFRALLVRKPSKKRSRP